MSFFLPIFALSFSTVPKSGIYNHQNMISMRKLLLLFACLAMVVMTSAQTTEIVTNDGTHCRVSFYSPNIVRVTKWASTAAEPQAKSLVVTMQPQSGLNVSIKESGKTVTMTSSQLSLTIDGRTGNIRFAHAGKNLLREKSHAFEMRTEGPDKGAYRVTQTYLLDKDEPIYGLGTLQDGKLNRRGTERKFLEQSNLEDFQYVIQSLKGWGIFWDNYSRADFIDNASGMTFSAEVGDALDYYFMYGGSADGVNAQMRALSGQVPMFPLWTFGYWQCKERYKSTKEVLDVVRWHRQNEVPIDGIIQDWQYWGSNYTWNAMDFLAEDYADGPQMVKRVHDMNAHLMISIWASFGMHTKAYKQLNEKGLLFPFKTWPQSGLTLWPPRQDYPSPVKIYDAFSQEARDIYWNNLKTLYNYGCDAWWMDSTDPDFFDPTDSDYDQMASMGTWRKMRNAFPLCTVSGVYEGQRATGSDKRVFIMTRSAFAGQQRYGSGLWSGDVASSWDMLRKQIPAGLNYTMTGCPNFNTDIGGFFCGSYNTKGGGSAPRNKQYQELYVRWMQYGFFCPVFRSHGADAPREIYQFGKKGEPIFDAIEAQIRLRYQFIPYLYSTAWQVTSNNDSYLRALVYDFPGDRRVWDMADEFMFGRSILAAPITSPQYTQEKVMREDAMSGWDRKEAKAEGPADVDFTAKKTAVKYLPKGADWYDYYTGQRYKGGQDVTIETSIDRVPMFVKAGSILPLAPVMQYAGERKWDLLDVVVYPGADASFTLYEDEGDNYNYEKGAYSTITMRWDNARRTLVFESRKGQFPGMLAQRQFRVRLVGQADAQTVSYQGNEVSVTLR